jgi:hypothetical protein
MTTTQPTELIAAQQRNAKRTYLRTLIAAGVELQIGIRATGQPLGPGKVEEIPEHYGEIFQILVPAQFAENQNARPKMVLMPVSFMLDDIACIILPPRNVDGSAIETTTPSRSTPPGRTPGGLIIPGGS